ncbi:PR domain zinc finger protein 8 isoform X1 [Ascaphus truei]|uniref:PR domain zinc finger protein 8 isoform X1 n=2 Tax=Ascaphus truei TaxID=8439 RepID=UPI003F596C98
MKSVTVTVHLASIRYAPLSHCAGSLVRKSFAFPKLLPCTKDMSVMEDTGVQKTIWDGDAKVVQQCLTDIFTSVYTTCDVPENAIFGPCVLSHTSLYDSIAFVALKSTDKRTVPYIFRVDTSAANGSSEGLMWLRLVQSARNKEEQNLEAYIKNGQLFYRSLRRIAKDEELLVWYGKELTELLLLNPAKTPGKNTGSSQSTCLECNQRFQFEFPYVAHVRFRCPKRLHSSDQTNSEQVSKDSRELEPRYPMITPAKYNKLTAYQPQKENHKPTTDFHNLARDMETGRGSSSSSFRSSPSPKNSLPHQDVESTSESHHKAKRKYDDQLDENRSRRLEASGRFLDRPMPSSKEDLVCSPQTFRASSYYSLEESGRLYAPPSPETGEAKRSAFVEVKKASRGVEDGDLSSENKATSPSHAGSPSGDKLLSVRSQNQAEDSSALGSAFTSVPQMANQAHERKSAFSQPRNSFSHVSPLQVMGQKLVNSGLNLDRHAGNVGPARLYPSDPLSVKIQGPELNGNCPLQSSLPKQSPFLFATTFWPKSSASPLQLQLPSTLTLLPPSFTSLCLPAQNWCAKCNASFRMTSDLVYHMRSHHKKEFAMEPLVKRRREEKLKCPICNESFRERHHLSRHMTSHN